MQRVGEMTYLPATELNPNRARTKRVETTGWVRGYTPHPALAQQQYLSAPTGAFSTYSSFCPIEMSKARLAEETSTTHLSHGA